MGVVAEIKVRATCSSGFCSHIMFAIVRVSTLYVVWLYVKGCPS